MADLLPKKAELYVYELSEQLLSSLNLIGFDEYLNEIDVDVSNLPDYNKLNKTKEEQLTKEELLQLRSKAVSNVLQCNVCKLKFDNQIDQRKHYRSDLHHINIKRNINGLPPVSSPASGTTAEKDNFANFLLEKTISNSSEEENENESIDNSDSENEIASESGEDSDSDTEEISTYLEEHLSISQNESTLNSFLNTKSPHIYFRSSYLPSEKNEVIGVYKVLFNIKELSNPLLALKSWNEILDKSSKMSALFMVGGGHFAGAIISHQRRNIKGNLKKQKETFQEQSVIMLEHKTLHRYTTRRKQGGSQSVMDNAKGKANSAGSTLRRYNENALKQDIQNLLLNWKPYLDKCDNIFIRARSVFDKAIFFESNNSSHHAGKKNNIHFINKNDPRLKTFPFTTGRPTIHELKRAWCELTYLKSIEKPKPIIASKQKTQSIVKDKSTELPQDTKIAPLTKEEEYSEELIRLVKKARAPLLSSFLKKNKLDINFRLKPESKYGSTPTLLHYASQHGIKQMVVILLSNMKADPTIQNNVGKTAADLNKSLSIKQAFQIARYNLGEDFVDWSKSHIDEPLSREQVEEKNRQFEELKRKETEEIIKKESKAAKARQKVETNKPKSSKGNILGSSSNGISLEHNLNSLTEEQKRRLMREQRARAAEARMARN